MGKLIFSYHFDSREQASNFMKTLIAFYAAENLQAPVIDSSLLYEHKVRIEVFEDEEQAAKLCEVMSVLAEPYDGFIESCKPKEMTLQKRREL